MNENPLKALLISAYLNTKEKQECEEHLEELARLTETFGAVVIKQVPCILRKYDAATYLTFGKAEEMCAIAKENNVDLVIIDDEIAPSQQRNLEKLFGRRVIDRTELILEVFAQRAATKEAKLQVALAKTRYEAPRLKRLWTHLSRQQGTSGGGSSGGGGYLKGEGETQIEIDRRILKKKIDVLKTEIEAVKSNRDLQRSARERKEIPTFAIIGYTNAGKSTLLNALTEANVFVEDKLFATLDTTTRKFTLPNHQEILLIDTVGFIRKLPHLLVAAFKSTLEESVHADILLHMIDVSHKNALDQAKTTFEVLKELGVENQSIINVLNKVDHVEDPTILQKFKIEYPHTVAISALHKTGFDTLLHSMIEELNKKRKLITFKIPQSEYSIVSEVLRVGNVQSQVYEENDVIITAVVPAALAGKLKKYTS